MRSKETQADYRYFDEPDLPPLVIEEEQINEARSRFERSFVAISHRGDERRFPAGPARLVEFLSHELSLHERDAVILAEHHDLLELLLSAGQAADDYSTVAGIILNELRPMLIAHPEFRGRIDAGGIAELAKLLQTQKASYGQMKAVLNEVLTTGCTVGEAYMRLGFDQQVDGSDLAEACAKVIASNEKAVADIRKGKSAALQVLVGQVMKSTRGKANPEDAVAELKMQLGL
jgi:aspartyl-tRNA(Asn)/glutamyl-tRNA(Gln) amidotransferase subunit B